MSNRDNTSARATALSSFLDDGCVPLGVFMNMVDFNQLRRLIILI